MLVPNSSAQFFVRRLLGYLYIGYYFLIVVEGCLNVGCRFLVVVEGSVNWVKVLLVIHGLCTAATFFKYQSQFSGHSINWLTVCSRTGFLLHNGQICSIRGFSVQRKGRRGFSVKI